MMALSSSYAETLAATMRLAFPTPFESSLDTPNLFILNDLLQYLCKCAQTHKSPISKKMNHLCVAIDPTLYSHYSGGKAYPDVDYPFPPEIVDVPNYSGCTNTNDHANVKVTHGMALKQLKDIINMNSALIDTFLNLVPVAFKQIYEQIRMENPNSDFCKMFAWFVIKYGHTSADDCKANCTDMALEWHPSQGFQLLAVCLFRGATFVNLAKHPIPDDDIVNIGIPIIHRTGLFVEEYKAWITRGYNPTNNMDFSAFHTFWETAVNIVSFTATLALQHGYGMNAVEDNPSAASLTDAISNFGMAYATTQESLHNNNAFINAMQGQTQMICNTIGKQPPAGMLQYPQQNNQDCRSRGGRGGQQQNQGQQGQPSGGGGGTNNGGGGNRLYRGNHGDGTGYNQGSRMTFNGGSGNYPTCKAHLRPRLPHSSSSKIGTNAIPMAAKSIAVTQVPPAHSPVSTTNMPLPGPTQ
jgi:hypothetical protein